MLVAFNNWPLLRLRIRGGPTRRGGHHRLFQSPEAGEKNGNVINMDALLLHKQHHEKKVWLEVAVPPQDYHGHQGV